MSAEIPLDRALVDSIVFGMEDQEHVFYLDTELSTVVPETIGTTDANTERFVRLPPWRSVDGYNLMNRFVQNLRNPIFRERLRHILGSGRGVFRQFKDVLAERPDIQRIWQSFKQREMRRIVGEWLNDQREIRGLERLELSEDEETLPLIESDFVFTHADALTGDDTAELERVAFGECHENEQAGFVELLYEIRSLRPPAANYDGVQITTAETPAGETAGVLLAALFRRGEESLSVVRQIYVEPEYRGLGLAAALLREHVRRCRRERVRNVSVQLTGSACDYEESLAELGFEKTEVSMTISTETWYRENESG